MKYDFKFYYHVNRMESGDFYYLSFYYNSYHVLQIIYNKTESIKFFLNLELFGKFI